MRKFLIIGFMILLAFDTLAQVGFKLAAMHSAPAAFDLAWIWRVVTEGWVYCAVAGYIGAFITYMSILKHAHIGPAFAATHLEIVTVTIFSVLVLGEKLSPLQVAGGGLIILGIFLLATEKQQDEPDQGNGGSSAGVEANTGKSQTDIKAESLHEHSVTR